jgi:hypothetical protein
LEEQVKQEENDKQLSLLLDDKTAKLGLKKPLPLEQLERLEREQEEKAQRQEQARAKFVEFEKASWEAALEAAKEQQIQQHQNQLQCWRERVVERAACSVENKLQSVEKRYRGLVAALATEEDTPELPPQKDSQDQDHFLAALELQQVRESLYGDHGSKNKYTRTERGHIRATGALPGSLSLALLQAQSLSQDTVSSLHQEIEELQREHHSSMHRDELEIVLARAKDKRTQRGNQESKQKLETKARFGIGA